MKKSNNNVWADLVIAILAVNNYRLDRMLQQYEQLEQAGLFEPNNLQRFDVDAIVHRLISAGYDRGPWLTKLMAERLKALGLWVGKQDRMTVEGTLTRESKDVIARLLGAVKGVGPTVVETFLILRV